MTNAENKPSERFCTSTWYCILDFLCPYYRIIRRSGNRWNTPWLIPQRHRHLSSSRQVATEGADNLRHLVEPHSLHSRRPHDLRCFQRAAEVDLIGVEVELIDLPDALHLMGVGALDAACREVTIRSSGGIIGGGLLVGDCRRPVSIDVRREFAHLRRGFNVLELALGGDADGADASISRRVVD